MPRGSTSLDNYEYDSFLADNKREKELLERKHARKSAHKSDLSGYHFGIDSKPVYVKDIHEFRQELKKRGLGIEGEIQREKK